MSVESVSESESEKHFCGSESESESEKKVFGSTTLDISKVPKGCVPELCVP
jgi:hypothetical protein